MKKIFRRLNLGFLISDAFAANKWSMVALIVCCGTGIIMGIGFAAAGSVSFINVSVTKFYSITNGISAGGVFVRRMFSSLVCCALVLAFSLNLYLCPATFLLVMLRGYYFGALTVLLVYEYAFSGVICLIFALIPAQVVFLTVLIVLSGYGISCSCKFRRFKSFVDMKQFFSVFGALYCVSLVGTMLECLLIVMIVNPLFL